MTDQWKAKALSSNTTPAELTEKLLNEEGVVFLMGKNDFGDEVYAYVQLTLRKLQELQERLKINERFVPSDFGSVLAAGKGEPSQELRSEMAVMYNMVDKPIRTSKKQKPKMPSFAAKHAPKPKGWGGDQ